MNSASKGRLEHARRVLIKRAQIAKLADDQRRLKIKQETAKTELRQMRKTK